jgi:hypothetical protein
MDDNDGNNDDDDADNDAVVERTPRNANILMVMSKKK